MVSAGLDDPVSAGGFGLTDATINFNTQFSFDFDNSDGVGAALVDFETVAAHEIGHALGFVSVVDTIDFLIPPPVNQPPVNVQVRPMDLFRFQNNVAGQDPATPAEFTNNPRFLVPGGDAIFDSLGSELRLSTGRFFGDGRQASHFKDNDLSGVLIGIMDPTLANGTAITLSDDDILIFDLIGYDTVIPEPSSLVLLGMGSLGLIGYRWRKKKLQAMAA